MTDAPDILRELAAAYDVDAEVWGWQGDHLAVADGTLRAVLGALGVDASDDESCRAALEWVRTEREVRGLPYYVVARAGEPVSVAAPSGAVTLHLEDGGTQALAAVAGEVVLDADLPSGYHRLTTASGDECLVIRPPRTVPLPERLRNGPAWGLAAQLYSVRSRRSWGVGDLGDLGTLATWAAREHGADFVLVNPLHAAEVVAPMNPSPYSPTTRRFGNPMYLRVEDVPGHDTLPPDVRARVDALGDRLRAAAPADGLVDRDAAWAAKRAALALLHEAVPEHPDLAPYIEREGAELQDFATWCALTEVFGGDRAQWPQGLQHPRSPDVATFAADHAARVGFHRWLQWLVDRQLAQAQQTALDAGMGLGVVHDVAVGVSPTGADAWARQGELATTVSVGAPPDAYSQTGQDWDQPPWRPDRLAELGYAPFRDLFAAALRHSGGMRVDHVIGLFRLWWIPRGAPALEGTYVHYDHHALIGVLMIEAERAGAVLVGEDLGNVEPWVRDYLRERGVFGTSILWFENADDRPIPPEQWRELCLASVTTHDLPPTAGYLQGVHVQLRHELGLLTRDYDDELADDRAGRERWLTLLRDEGLLAAGDDDPEHVVLALHRLLGRAPSLLRCAALTDAVGDHGIQNQPGTTQVQHPNWRLPLAGPDGVPMLLEDVVRDPRAAAVAEAMRTA